MPELLSVTFYDGKYTIIQEESGGLSFLRNGMPWKAANNSDWQHAGMILAAAQEIQKLRLELGDEDKCLHRAISLMAKRDCQWKYTIINVQGNQGREQWEVRCTFVGGA